MTQYKTKKDKARFYNSGAWKSLRIDALHKCNHECQRCKRLGRVTIDTNEKNKNDRKKIQLIVHHIKELEHYPELALELDNLEVQCVDCHNETHGRVFGVKRNKWKHDERW